MKSAGETGWISRRSLVIVKRWIRASSRRSHHSSPSASGENCPLKTNPSLFQGDQRLVDLADRQADGPRPDRPP